jgi:hypothetical protein
VCRLDEHPRCRVHGTRRLLAILLDLLDELGEVVTGELLDAAALVEDRLADGGAPFVPGASAFALAFASSPSALARCAGLTVSPA